MMARREREHDEVHDPLGMAGLEFIEYATADPAAMGAQLESMGFVRVARHRSRPVLLYRQGTMNIVVNAVREPVALDPWALPGGDNVGSDGTGGVEGADAGDVQGVDAGSDAGEIAHVQAVAFRVANARDAFERCVERGAWPIPIDVEPMELHIPAIHGVGASRIYLVDRWQDFSIFDVDFVREPGADVRPAAIAGLHWFGIVQYVGEDRIGDWMAFYRELFGFVPLPEDAAFGVLPSGRILRSPCGRFHLQLVELAGDVMTDEDERFHRVAFGAPDVLAAVEALRSRGARFVESDLLRSNARGALTRSGDGQGVPFELVPDAPDPAAR